MPQSLYVIKFQGDIDMFSSCIGSRCREDMVPWGKPLEYLIWLG